MKNQAIIGLLGGVIIAGMILYRGTLDSRTANSAPGGAASESASQALASQIDDQANVAVLVAPVDVSPDSPEWKFSVGMNTHTVELDQDMVQVSALVDDNGKEYKPLRWDGPTGGHHIEGVLTFAKLSPTPNTIQLRISDVGGVERVFIWQVKK